MEPFLGQVMLFGGNFAPRGWAFCHGQLLPIAQNTALFSLLGTIYGGDGRTTFALPDLRGRAAVGAGSGPGLSDVREGQKGGRESVTLSVINLPSHNHSAIMKTGPDTTTTDVSTGNRLAHEARAGQDTFPIYTSEAGTDSMAADAIQVGNTGNNQPFSIQNPSLGLNYIIALQGVFPSRS